MTDNQSSGARSKSNRTESKSGGGPKVRKTSRVRDGVVLSVSAIEKERERLQRRTRAALYPLLPVVDPTRFRRPSLHTEKRRHRKHCRKRLDDDHRQRYHPHRHYQHSRARPRLDSRTRLVTTTSESDGSSLTCSRPPGVDPLPHCSPLCNEQVQSFSRQSSDAENETAPPPSTSAPRQHHHHYHYHCHHHKHPHKSLRPENDGSTQLAGGRDPEACDKDSSSSNSRSRKIVSFIVASVASFILLMCVALVAVTLRLTPAIDELGKYIQRHDY